MRSSGAWLKAFPVGSAWFAHFDRAGAIAHVDIRGPTYKGSLTGGVKSLFRLPLKGPPLPRLVVTEAAIDALSLAAIENLRGDTLYAATGGGMGPGTIAALETLLAMLQRFRTRYSVAPPTPMDRAIALPTGTNHSRENPASRLRGFALPSRAATGTKCFAFNRLEDKKKPECRKSSHRYKPRVLPTRRSRGRRQAFMCFRLAARRRRRVN
jgi:hypothetical protein